MTCDLRLPLPIAGIATYLCACRKLHYLFCTVLFSIDPPSLEHGWPGKHSIKVRVPESPNMASGAGKDVASYFSLSCPHEQSAGFHAEMLSGF